jgi:hypothetical protein
MAQPFLSVWGANARRVALVADVRVKCGHEFLESETLSRFPSLGTGLFKERWERGKKTNPMAKAGSGGSRAGKIMRFVTKGRKRAAPPAA